MIGHRLGHRLGHALGHLLANHALSVGAKPLNFATGTVFSSNNATGGTPGKPATVSGDLLVLAIVSTSAPTPPAGWTLVASQTDVNFTQQLNVYTAPYNVAGSTACSQATSGPFCAVVMRVRGNHGGVLSVGTIGSASGNSTANPEAMASVTPSVAATVLALGASSGQSASTSPVYTPSSGWTNLPPSGNFRWRLGMAIRAYKAGVASSGSFSSTGYAAGSSSSWNKLAIVFKETVANSAPTAAFSSSTSNLAATFTDASTDSDGTIASWSWDFGDSSTSTAQNPSHTYAAAGTYTVSLTVTDNGGATNSVSHSVTVSAAAPSMLGAHTMVKQSDSGGSSPAVTSPITTQASGSAFWAMLGGWAYTNTPTDNKGNTYAKLGIFQDFAGAFPNEGLQAWVAYGAGGSGHTLSLVKDASWVTNELSMPFVEITGVARCTVAQSYDATVGSTHTQSITVDGAALLVAVWNGDSGAHPSAMTATPDAGWTVIESYLNIPSDSADQMAVAVKQVASAGTYSVTWTNSPTQGAELSIFAFQAAAAPPPGPSVLQHTVINGANPSPNTSAGITTQASGSSFLVCVAGGGTFSGTLTVSDNKGNTYTQVMAPTQSPTTHVGAPAWTAVYLCSNGVGGAGHTFTVATTQGDYASAIAAEISSPVATDTAVVHASDTATPYSAGSITTVTDHALVLSFVGSAGTVASLVGTPGNGFSKVDEISNDAYWTCSLASKSVSPAGAVSDSWTFNDTIDAGLTLIALKGV